MTYYLLLPNQFESDITDHNILGDVSFQTFYAGIAWKVLSNLIKSENNIVLEQLTIKDSSSKSYSVSEFLSTIDKYKIVLPY